MYKQLRREDKKMDADRAGRVLASQGYGVLSTCGKAGDPYGIPLHYVYENDSIYFHCAGEGQKWEYMMNDNRVSFCVTGDYHIEPDRLTTVYESVIVRGKAAEVSGEEKKNALRAMLRKYAPDNLAAGEIHIADKIQNVKVMKIIVEHMTGKAGL